MGSDRIIGRLGDHLAQVIDNRGKTPPNDIARTDYELLEVNCLTGSGRRPNYGLVRKFVTKDIYNSWFRNGHPKPNDVIISTVGSIGEVCISEGRGSIAQNLIALSPEANSLTGEFLYYYLCSPAVKNELLTLNISSVQPSIKVPHLLDLQITLPPLPEQKAITHILGSLDDKIELNRRMNATLEAMAQALFKSWFVDFDPVIDNALAAGNPIPEELAPRAETRKQALASSGEQGRTNGTTNRDIAKLFPDSFQETESMGWIPEGWEDRPLYDTANFINGSAFKSRDFSPDNSGLPIVKIAELKSGVSAQTKFTNGDFPAKYRIENGEMLYSWSGSPETSLEVFKWFGGPGWLNQHIFRVCTNSEPQKHFAYYLLKELKPQLIAIATNKQTTGLGHVTVADMKRLRVPYPDNTVLSTFSNVAGKFYDSSTGNDLQIKTLTKLRDTLLPKLISGELRIPEAEKLAEGALA